MFLYRRAILAVYKQVYTLLIDRCPMLSGPQVARSPDPQLTIFSHVLKPQRHHSRASEIRISDALLGVAKTDKTSGIQ